MKPPYRWILLLSLPPLAAATLWGTRPRPIAQYSTDLAARSSSQRHNIRQAAQAIDGIPLAPGQEFSFNRVVGPRTRIRGYQSAPAFLTAETVDSVGGGICQLSSSLYNAALLAGLTIVERHAHYTTVQSVPPGLDATVWYGLADLRFRNPHPWPIQIQIDGADARLVVRILGRQGAKLATLRIQRQPLNASHLQVRVYRDDQRISEDRYVVSEPEERAGSVRTGVGMATKAAPPKITAAPR